MTSWYIDDDGIFSNGGWQSLSDYTSFDGTIQIQGDWVGKTLYFSKSFQDDQGNFETSMSLSGEPYKIGIVTAPNTETETLNSPAEFNFMLIHDGNNFYPGEEFKIDPHPLVSRMPMEPLN